MQIIYKIAFVLLLLKARKRVIYSDTPDRLKHLYNCKSSR